MRGDDGGACVRLPSEKPEEPFDGDGDGVDGVEEADTPIASQSYLGRLPGALKDSGETRPLTLAEAREAYQDDLREAAASPHYGDRQRRADGHVSRILQSDRFLLAGFKNPHTVLLSLSIDSVADGVRVPPVNLFEEIKTAWPSVRRQIRYQFSDKRSLNHEYVALVAGTDHWATPHLHVLIWIDGEIDQSALRPAVSAFVESCGFAPDDGTGNPPADAISIRGPENQELALDSVRTDMIEDRGAATEAAHYVSSQVPHISPPREASDSELLHGATTIAAPSRALSFSSGCWAPGDGETPPEGSLTMDYFDVSSQNQSDSSPPIEASPRARTSRLREAGGGPPTVTPSRARALPLESRKSGLRPRYSGSRRGPPPPADGSPRYKKGSRPQLL